MPKPSPRGFTCPHCKSDLTVRFSYRPQSCLVVRYRKCVTCGHRVTTEERVSKGRKPAG